MAQLTRMSREVRCFRKESAKCCNDSREGLLTPIVLVATTFNAAGLPNGFHLAAAEIYERMAHFKNDDPARLEQVIEALLPKR